MSAIQASHWNRKRPVDRIYIDEVAYDKATLHSLSDSQNAADNDIGLGITTSPNTNMTTLNLKSMGDLFRVDRRYKQQWWVVLIAGILVFFGVCVSVYAWWYIRREKKAAKKAGNNTGASIPGKMGVKEKKKVEDDYKERLEQGQKENNHKEELEQELELELEFEVEFGQDQKQKQEHSQGQLSDGEKEKVGDAFQDVEMGLPMGNDVKEELGSLRGKWWVWIFRRGMKG